MASFRLNAIVSVAVLALFLRRVYDVGFAEAIAEAFGLSELYAHYASAYYPLEPELFRAQPLEYWLDDALAGALMEPNATHRHESLANLVVDHGGGVFSFQLFKDSVARRLAAEVDNFVESGHVSARPNSMNDYGVVLGADGLDGLDEMLQMLVSKVLTEFSAALYGPLIEASAHGATQAAAARAARAVDAPTCCAAQHAFVVRYSEHAQRGLDLHHDASEVTLNVCLERREGADERLADGAAPVAHAAAAAATAAHAHEPSHLQFCGFVGDAAHRRATLRLRHAVGRAIVHLGAHRHGASELERGTRQNLIVWGRRQRPAAGADGTPTADDDTTDADALAATRLHAHELPADLECLSWTHDADFDDEYEARGLALPPAAVAHRAQRAAQAELFELARRATDAHIAALPEAHRPIVRLLRHAARQQPPPPGAGDADAERHGGEREAKGRVEQARAAHRSSQRLPSIAD